MRSERSRGYQGFGYRTRDSWTRERRVIAKAEWLPGQPIGETRYHSRFVVTSLRKPAAQTVYEAIPDPCARDGVHAADSSGVRVHLPVLEGFLVDLGQLGTDVKAQCNRVHDAGGGARRPPRARILSDSPSRPQKGVENTRIPALRSFFELATRNPMPVPNASRETISFST